jgi:hypothetical protein
MDEGNTCAKCGAMLHENEKICGLCGSRVDSPEDVANTEPEVVHLSQEDRAYEQAKAELEARLIGGRTQPTTLTHTKSAMPEGPPGRQGKSKKRLIGIIVVVVCLTGLCLCSSYCARFYLSLPTPGNFSANPGYSGYEKRRVSQVLDEEMKAMKAKDYEAAYALMSSTNTGKIDDLKKLDYHLFLGYKRLSINRIMFYDVTATFEEDNVTKIIDTVDVKGAVYYDDGTTGVFTTSLEKEKDEWRIDNMSVERPSSPSLNLLYIIRSYFP